MSSLQNIRPSDVTRVKQALFHPTAINLTWSIVFISDSLWTVASSDYWILLMTLTGRSYAALGQKTIVEMTSVFEDKISNIE
jgi:hypothetical protein